MKIEEKKIFHHFEVDQLSIRPRQIYDPSLVTLNIAKNVFEENELCSMFTETLHPQLPACSAEHFQILDQKLTDTYEKWLPPKSELLQRKEVKKLLDRIISDGFGKSFRLFEFGSAKNGFPFRGSDLDLCLVNDENIISTIKTGDLADKLKKSRKFSAIETLPDARIPIVKFEMRRFKITGDISLDNRLALRNTQLLASYASIDERVPILATNLKVLTKKFKICDGSLGYLSSYAYNLMIISYLQSVKVLPYLQESNEINYLFKI